MTNKKKVNDDYRQGFRDAIKILEEAKHTPLRKWSHSRDIKFAPVELRDYLVIYYNKYLKKEK